MFTSYILKTLKLIINVFNVAFFMGMFFFVFCEISMHLQMGTWLEAVGTDEMDQMILRLREEVSELNPETENTDFFIEAYDFPESSYPR